MKKCNKCANILDLTLFSKKTSNKDGYSNICKNCEQLRKRQYYLENKENILREQKERYAAGLIKIRVLSEEQRLTNNRNRKLKHSADPRYGLITEARKRAKQKGIDFSITLDDIIVTELCPILLIPMVVGKGKFTKNSPTLDRVDNSLGYVKNNVMVVSHLANSMKNSASPLELIRFAEFINEFFKEKGDL